MMKRGAAFILLRRREVPACGRQFEDAAEGGAPSIKMCHRLWFQQHTAPLTLANARHFLQPGFRRACLALTGAWLFSQLGSGNNRLALAGARFFPQPGFSGQKKPWLGYFRSASQGWETENRSWLARDFPNSQGLSNKRKPGWDISVHPARVGKRKIDPGHYTLFLPARVAHVFYFLSAPQIALSAAHHCVFLRQITIATRTGVLRSSFALFHSKAAPPFSRLFDESPPQNRIRSDEEKRAEKRRGGFA